MPILVVDVGLGLGTNDVELDSLCDIVADACVSKKETILTNVMFTSN